MNQQKQSNKTVQRRGITAHTYRNKPQSKINFRRKTKLFRKYSRVETIFSVLNLTPHLTPHLTPQSIFRHKIASPEGIRAYRNIHHQKGHLTPRSNAPSIQCPSEATQSPSEATQHEINQQESLRRHGRKKSRRSPQNSPAAKPRQN